VTLKNDGSLFYGKKEARFLKRKAERMEEKIEKERLKNEKNTQCSWWHWVFLVIFLLITGEMLVKKSSLISLISLIALISIRGCRFGETDQCYK
jgi:Na+/H+ antiporter NhaD/arsenite permease-like protein